MGKREPKIKELENQKWTPYLAYCVGLIATDGCLYKDGRHISFTSADIQLVKLFKSLMGLSNKIGYKASGSSNSKCPHVQFGNVKFYRWLITLGLTPKKSLTLGPLNIPSKLLADFVRGCFDGDGSIYSYMDRRWVKSHMFYTSFASGSRIFTDWFQNQLNKNFGIKGHVSKNKGKNFYQLKFAKSESIVLISKMYYNKHVPCLERKRQKIIKILEIHRRIQSENPRIFLNKTSKIEI